MTWRLSRVSRLISRLHNDASNALPVVHIPGSAIFDLDHQTPVLRNVSLTVYPHQSWAVISADAVAGKAALFGALVGTHRVTPPAPPPGGLFPFLQDADTHRYVQTVRFAHRPAASGDGFYDFTARYGAVREEDKRTLRETFFPDIARPIHPLAIPSFRKTAPSESVAEMAKRATTKAQFDFLTNRLRLVDLLDLPMIALSNGQTRRARIAKALLSNPRLLLLDEPLTGLDDKSRHILLALLQDLKKMPSSPHIMLGLRAQDPIPDWTTHIALVEDDGTVRAGQREDVLPTHLTPSAPLAASAIEASPSEYSPRTSGAPLIAMTGVTVQYGPRKILNSIQWTIRENSRWHLIGENGAGKTTLLALLTGEHPQSYTQSENLRLFDKERGQWATPVLHKRIGRVSPELFNAFPRRHSLTVWDAVGTGFDGGFVPKGARRVGLADDGEPLEPDGAEERWRLRRMHEVMRALGPSQWHPHPETVSDEEYFACPYVDLTPGEQSIVLLMRALVAAPPLVLLDEAWAGMDKAMIQAAHRYLRDGGGGLTKKQACIVVSHWEQEVPWGPEQGVERFKLSDGSGQQIYGTAQR